MKTLAAFVLSLSLVCGAAFATDKETESQTSKSAAGASRKTVKGSTKKSETAALAVELEKVREALDAQQQQIQQLREELARRDREFAEAKEAAATASSRAAEASARANEALNATAEVKSESASLNSTVSDLKASDDKFRTSVAADQTKANKSFDERLKAVGPFSFSGDFRLRDEPFFGGPANQSQVRNRERFRARLNITAKLNSEIGGGISVASGDLNDPISTNQTANQFYTRKPFTLDRAFINYKPNVLKVLTLTGGKFAYPFYRTELTWDNDLNPEGLAQTVSFDFKSIPGLKKIAIVGFELPFTEVAGVSATNKSIVQSAVYGGQLQTIWEFSSWLKFSAYGAFYNYHNADPLALALRRANLSNPQSPANGLLPIGGSSVQNSIATITTSSILPTTTPDATVTVNTNIVSAMFNSKFALFDAIARFDITTPYKRVPLVVLGDYVQNTRACANAANVAASQAAFVAPAGVTVTTSNPACFSRERRGYWLEARAGRLQETGDLQLSYTRMFIEKEAVMGAFNFSDLRQNSNVSEHRIEAIYQGYKNVQLQFTGLFGRPLNWHTSAAPEPILKRLQFDVIYKF